MFAFARFASALAMTAALTFVSGTWAFARDGQAGGGAPFGDERGSMRLAQAPWQAGALPRATAGRKIYQTVQDSRNATKEVDNPGAPDASKDFSGFWKETCDKNFGLQIKPTGTRGMYSVSFCGPGACARPGTYRPNTFITGDPSYKVVTQDEIKVSGRGDVWTSYRKCSPDPDATPVRH